VRVHWGMATNRPPDRLDAHTSGHSRRLRAALRAARKAQNISAHEVCRRLAQIATDYARIDDPDAAEIEPPHVNTLYTWERFERHPSINLMAAWARVLGMRLIVDLDDAKNPRPYVLLDHPESAQIARIVDAMNDEKRRALLQLLTAET
jgi:transcriptional regulator with XRE-family HTH domain